MSVEEALAAVPLLACLDPAQRAQLAAEVDLRRVGLGEVVFAEGDPGDRFYVVHSGSVRVVRRDGAREVTLKTLGPGEFFGEAALLDDAPRNATVRAAAETALLSLEREPFLRLLAARPELAGAVRRVIESRALASFLRLCTGLGAAARAKDVQALIEAAVPEEREARGEVVPAEAESLYAVQRGEVLVFAGEDELARLGPGETFGEDAALGARLALRYVAVPGSLLLRLPAAALAPLLAARPLRAHLEERVARWNEVLRRRRSASEASALTEDQVKRTQRQVTQTLTESLSRLPAATLWKEERQLEAQEQAQAYRPRGRAFARLRAFPFIEQQEAVDCGAACLSMILAHYGKRVSVARLRELARVGLYGASMASLIEAAQGLGFDARGLHCPLLLLRRQPLPAIAHWEGVHYLVVYEVGENHVKVSDPALGRRTLTLDEFERGWTGKLVTLVPTPAIEQVEESRPYWRPFLAFFAPPKRFLGEVLLASLALQALALAMPLFTQQVVDKVATARSTSFLHLLLGGMVVVVLARVLLTAARGYLLAHLSQRVSHTMLTHLVRHLLGLSLSFFQVKRPGDIMSRFEDSRHIQALLTGKPLQLILDLLTLVTYGAAMLWYSPTLTLLALATLVPLLVLTLTSAPIMAGYRRRMMAAHGRTASSLLETLTGVATVKAFGRERWARGKWEGDYARLANTGYQAELWDMLFSSVGGLIHQAGTILVLFVGATQVVEGRLTIGQLMAFQVMIGYVYGPVLGFVELFDDYQQATVSAERLGEILDVAPERGDEARVRGARLRGHLRFEKVFFRYGGPETPPVLKGISFELLPGQRLALVGRSGSGKTTLARLLLALHAPSEGRIFLDEVDVREIEPRTLRRNVATVLQDGFIFQGTVRDCIAAGDPDADAARVAEAARLACADEFIRELPQGYETLLERGAQRLSGGQRQRLQIARALYRAPSALIFDEATSALDPETEARVGKNLDGFLAERASIWIAHRMSTVRSADLILVLEGGEVRERGTHESLMAQRGLYYQLCSQQLAL